MSAITVSSHIAAPPERVWQFVGDLERWDKLLPTIDAVQRLDPGATIDVGARFRVRQPGLPPAEYKVTRWVPGEAFDWVATTPGVRTTGVHEIHSNSAGSSTLDLSLIWEGPLAGLLRILLTSKARSYVEQEAATFKQLAQSD